MTETIEVVPDRIDRQQLAQQLVEAARAEGVELVGPGGLLTGLTKQVLETALDVELTEHLGHERNERSGSGNVRNGSSRKTVPPTSERCGSRSHAIGWAASPRRWCPSIRVGWPASTTRC